MAIVGVLAFGAGWQVNAWKNAYDRESDFVELTADKSATETADRQASERVGGKVVIASRKGEFLTRQILKEIAQYAKDNDGDVPAWFVGVLDAAATGDLSRATESTGSASGTAPRVSHSETAASVVENYGSCRQIREQLIGWQEWYAETRRE